MKQKLLTLLLTALFGLTGTNAWALDQDGGVYQIGTAQDLADFATLVNGGTTGANAVLTADIDLDGVAWTPIGNDSKKFTGTFDGKGHAITNFSYTATSDYNGLFGYIYNATVKNFSISGTLISVGYNKNGVIGCATGTSKVTGIHSSLTISASNYKAHTGGIVGGDNGATTDKIIVDGCSFSGTMTHSGTGDCQAGIMGYTGYSTIRNCIFSGTITGESSKYGGILGYCKQPSFGGVQYCLSIGKIVANSGNTTAAAIIANWNGGATSNVKNNYYCLPEGSTTTIAIGNKASSCEAPIAVTAEQLASGEVCYALNGNQSTIAFYQTIPDDAQPTFDATHGQVYVNGRKHCNGDAYEGTFYSNENVGVVTDDHDYSNGFCTYCDKLDESFDGDYPIKNATQLKNFATFVNAGNFTVNAKLTNDIDMSSLSSWTAIGNWGSTSNGSACFQGHFDGQGHTIKDFNFTATHNYYGLFGVISTGALIENFCINGTINSSYQYAGGVAAYSRDNTPTIRNIHSFVNINNTHTSGRPGGILGGVPANNSKTIIENCAYSGTLNAGELGGNYGGIAGYIYNGSGAVVEITNCLFDGTILNGTANGSCGGIVGYNNGGTATIKNCLSIGSITSGAAGQFFGALNGNNSTYAGNNYYVGSAAQSGSGKAIGTAPVVATVEQLASGEICYALNGDQSNIAFYQNIDEGDADAVPVLDATHGQVYMNGHKHCDGTAYEGNSYSNENLGMVTDDHDFVDGICSYCNTLDETFLTAIEGVFEIGTPAQLKWFAAYVNQVDAAANAKLTAAINLTGVAWTSIGAGSGSTGTESGSYTGNPYTGTFDGQGNSITGFNASSDTEHLGLFGDTKNATIKNFNISGSLTMTGGYFGGVVACPYKSTIENVHSSLVIRVPNAGVHHVGGVVGSARGGNTIDRCSFSGSLTVVGSTDNFAGIAGYITSGDSVVNCANYAKITFGNANCAAGGIAGYLNSTSAYIQNCLNTGSVIFSGEGTPIACGSILGKTRGYSIANMTNNYWLEGSADQTAIYEHKSSGSSSYDLHDPKNDFAESIATDQLASGEVAYNLGAAWSQLIGTDDVPVIGTENPVLYVGTVGYATLYDTAKDWKLNGNATAYIAHFDGVYLDLIKIDDIPASTAVILKGKYYNKLTTTATSDVTANDLKGTDTDTVADGAQYVLAKPTADEESPEGYDIGFYRAKVGSTIKAGKAYFRYTDIDNGPGSVKAFYFIEDNADAIEKTLSNSPLKGENIYNVAGQKLSKMQKGINIVGGKKVMVK